MSRRSQTTRGFTLLEMLVATALIAVLAGSMYASLSIAFRARRSAMDSVGPVRKAALAMDFVAEDLRSAVVPTGTLAGPFLGEDLADDAGRDSDVLIFYTTGGEPLPEEGIGDIRKIELSCEPADDGRTQILVRRITTNLLAPREPEPAVEVLCRGVVAFSLRYFDGTEWLDAWDSTTEDDTLPVAVEVTLQLAEGRPPASTTLGAPGGGYLLTRLFLIPCGAAVDAGEIMGISP